MRHHRVIIAAGLLALGSAGCGDSGSGGGGAIQLGSTGDADEGPGGSGVDGHSGGVDAGGAGPSGDAGGGGGATDTVGGDGTGGGGHLGVLDLLEPETWCSRVAAGPAGERAGLLGLADAFVELRQFGVMSMPDALDEALRKALVTAQGDPELALAHLAANRAGVCSFSAATRALGAASVSLDAGVATVKPGTGEVTLPAGAEVVILDLRDLPAVPELRAVLGAALAPALASTDAGSARRVRRFEGLPGSFDNSSLKTLQVFLTAEWAATGAADLPIVILMGAALAPEVAELAIHLRRTGRAWLVGPGPVPAWVAESRWAPAGAAGIVYRYAVGASTTVWPDEVAVDFPVAALADAVQAARGGAPSVPEAAPATRPAMTTWAYANTPAAAQPGVQSHVAALVAFHGLVRRFFPYLGEVDSAALDERLLDLVSDQLATPSANFGEAQLWMRSYTHLLHDGFAGVFHEDPAWQTYRYRLGLVVDHDDAGLPLIVRSDNEHFAPGERVTQLDGVPVADWYDTHEHLGSWSADAARLAELSWFWRVGHGLAATATVLEVGGATREVPLWRSDAVSEDLGSAWSLRPSGPLDDLGYPDVYYLNPAYELEPTHAGLVAAVKDAHGASAIVLDLRAPGIASIRVAPLVLGVESQSPPTLLPTWTGPEEYELVDVTEAPWSDPTVDEYHGQVIALVGPETVGAAEAGALELRNQDDAVVIVGRPTGGVIGAYTCSRLAGNLGACFTAFDFRRYDGASHFGHSVIPDVIVQRGEDLTEDVDLMTALEVVE